MTTTTTTTTTMNTTTDLDEDEMLVFVYGTLKQGYGNNRLLSTAEFVRNATISGFKLHDSGFPVAEKTDDEHFVRGEIFKIKRSVHLRSLDGLEGYREGNENSMYHREVHTTEDGEEVSLYVGKSNYWPFDRMGTPWASPSGNRVEHDWKY